MNFRFVGAGSLVAVALGMGCGGGSASPHPEGTASTRSAVQGGTVDTTHDFAVGICGGTGGQCQLICSGGLIAPNLVVTARHCVDNTSSAQIDCSVATFGGPIFPAQDFYVTTDYQMLNGATFHRAQKIITPAATTFCGNDIALIILNSNITLPTYVTPEVQYPMNDRTRFTMSDTAIGYGLDDPANMNSAGTRRIKQNIAIQCIPGDSLIDCGGVAASGVADNEFASGDGTCEGDSGSSAYEQSNFNNGVPLSFGVLSRGGVSGGLCVGSVYTRLDKWHDLIVNAALEAALSGGYSAPSWTGAVQPPPPDAGAPPVDAGTKPGTDSGPGGPPAPGSLGSSCSTDGDCTSKQCLSKANDNNYVCSATCDANTPCASGFACYKGFCFADADGGPPSTQAATGNSGGCSASGAGADPTRPIPWGTAAIVGAALALAARRRRARAA